MSSNYVANICHYDIVKILHEEKKKIMKDRSFQSEPRTECAYILFSVLSCIIFKFFDFSFGACMCACFQCYFYC